MRNWRKGLLIAVVLWLGMPGIPRAEAKAARYWPVITQGDRDDKYSGEVRATQYLLRARGYKITVDGIYGKQTTRMVRAFQKKRGLVQNGNMSQPTWEALVIKAKKGSKGDATRAIQTLLRLDGYDVKVDGVFGKQTDGAVRKYQDQQGIGVDGVVGAVTWNRLVGGGDGGQH